MFSSEKLKVPRQECEPILSAALADIYDNKKSFQLHGLNVTIGKIF